MQILRTSLFTALGLGALAGTAGANAFNVNEHDAKVTGRGGASAASNTDPSSVIFNPGGIPVAEGTNVSVGGAIYIAKGSYEDATGKTETDSSPSVVPAFYLTSRVHDVIALGIGFHLPFGLAVSWPTGHTQAEVIQDQSLRTYFITPSIGFNLHKWAPGLSFGGGLDIVPATVQLENQLNFGPVSGSAVLGGDAIGFGGRVGVMYHPPAAKGLKLGVMYRSPVTLDFEGTGDFDIAQPYRSQLPADGDITTSITLPQSVWGGVAYSPIPQLELELNAVWIDWSAFDELRINLAGVDSMGNPNVTVSPQNYEDRVTFRFGAEYDVNEKVSLRAGFVYDPTPIPETTLSARLPDINRKNITLGASYSFGTMTGHLGMLWVTPGERDTSDEPYMPTYKATYGVQAFVASLMLSGSFGGSSSTTPPPSEPAPEPVM